MTNNIIPGSTPPGWYDDGSGIQRWWDGAGWTSHTGQVTAAAPQPSSYAPPQMQQPAAKKRLVWPWIVGGSVAVIGGLASIALLAVALFGFPRFSPPEPPTVVTSSDEPASGVAGPANMISDGIVIGTGQNAVRTPAQEAGDAPVPTDQSAGTDTPAIVVYVDYLCPFCQEFDSANRDLLETALAEGRATVEIHPISILDRASQGSNYSTRAANAAACVAEFDPDRFWAMHTALMDAQPKENTAGLTDGQLSQLVDEIGSSATADISDCITDQTFSPWVTAATERALTEPLPNSTEDSLTGTPTIIVNGQRYEGSITDAEEFADFVGSTIG